MLFAFHAFTFTLYVVFEDVLQNNSCSLRLIDIQGRVNAEHKLVGPNEKQFQINTLHLPAGLYFVEIQFEQEKLVRKLIIQP